MAITTILRQYNTSGELAYEYNPFYNYRINTASDSLPANSITDLNTKKLNFSIQHPIDMLPQQSYDGSVNLILNDNKNVPRLINSRFTVRENSTYEVVDRKGDNDTNIYDEDTFDVDSSLYKKILNIPNIKFDGVSSGGSLPVGNYTIYIRYCDSDENETDFIAETGIISCFKGNDKDPYSIDGGFRDENSGKIINLILTDIDSAYDYLKIYFTRSTSDVDQNQVTQAFKILQKFPVYNRICKIHITGNETIQDIDISEINAQYFMAKQARSQAICQNMLFLGNIVKPDIMYPELSNASLYIYPSLVATESKNLIGECDETYRDTSSVSTPYQYYNTKNIYYHVGYWNEEFYRLGIVYILKDNTLSPVYNIRGCSELSTTSTISSATSISTVSYNEETYIIQGTTNENSKGVIRIKDTTGKDCIYSIKINIPKVVLDYVEQYTMGFFIVRQKRIPTILAQAYTLSRDEESEVPVIPIGNDKFIEEGFLTKYRQLNHNYRDRLLYLSSSGSLSNSGFDSSSPKKIRNQGTTTALCPEFQVNQPFYEQLFTGTKFTVKQSTSNYSNNFLLQDNSYERHYYNLTQDGKPDAITSQVNVIGITNEIKIGAIGEYFFRNIVGEAETAYKFRYIGNKNTTDKATNLIRGQYTPYLGIVGSLSSGKLYNIYIPDYKESNINNYLLIRYNDDSPYYPISDRTSWKQYTIKTNLSDNTYSQEYFRGDCYICNFTTRLNRNFQDPSAPNNDIILDWNCWKDNYAYDGKQEDLSNINLGDVNAVELGSWITIKVRSTVNLSIRSIDHSMVSEESLTGHGRSFYPIQAMSVRGEYKVPESTVTNKGFNSTTGRKQYFTLPDSPVIKNKFETRIIYSDIAVNDAFKNGLRVFKSTNFRDYPGTYGSITKLVELSGYLVVIFEHAIGIIPVKEREVAADATGGNIFINTSNVLPENPKIISNMYGSQWEESVIKTPYGIYGVDTNAKKIWKTNGETIDILSDLHIESFLLNHISLTEREFTPIIGIRNVKTHYNAWKQDVMFTFYDNKYTFEEEAWNVCYNEKLENWSTFYSWIPSYSANISNLMFSFDRNSSKYISTLAVSKQGSEDADGIVVNNNIVSQDTASLQLSLVNREQFNGSTVVYTLQEDIYQNYKKFSLSGSTLTSNNSLYTNITNIITSNWSKGYNCPVVFLWVQAQIKSKQDASQTLATYKSVIALTTETVYSNYTQNGARLNTDFWKHGIGGNIDIADKVLPCKWYGVQHPFEIEFIVNGQLQAHKIFDNLVIIGNNTEPESFHYEIVGDCYDFAEDKQNIFYRQEATKCLQQYNGSHITYDRNFLDVVPSQVHKSTIFPLYYNREDTIENIYDDYKLFLLDKHDYKNLSGTEVVYYKKLNEFRLWNHCGAYNITKYGRLRGNMQYLEDKWNIQINPIFLSQKNEYTDNTLQTSTWTAANIPPLVLGNLYSSDLDTNTYVLPTILKDLGYSKDSITVFGDRESVKLKDKWMKVRIRYDGKKIAIINAIETLFSISAS